MRSSDFDPVALREGTEHELEHTDDRSIAKEIAMDHLAEDPRYYEKLRRMEAQPNRRRVYDAEDVARNMRETFTAKKVREQIDFPFDWPKKMQHIGDSLAVAYSSDKWEDDNVWTLYKHLAESKNSVFAIPGFLRDRYNPKKPWPTIGPMVDMRELPLPKDFAELALFEEVDLKLHTKGTDENPRFERGDAGIVKVTLAHGMLGGGKLKWSSKDLQPFLFIYDEKEGVKLFITGEELDVLADGIVG